MKTVSIESYGQILASLRIKILKPHQEDQVEDFIQTFPSSLHEQAKQVNQEISKHGYRIIKFISSCRNGFVVSANKGRVRFAIKAKHNRVMTDKGEVCLLEKNRELPENLKFYNSPYILALIESFETKDFHYTVTEECRCSLQELVKQIQLKYNEDTPSCFERYAYQLLQGLQQLSTGPEHQNSTKFVTHISPEDVLISHNSEIKLNPKFGQNQVPLGLFAFSNPLFSLSQKYICNVKRFSFSYAHLLLFMNGLSEKQILGFWYLDQQNQGYRYKDELDTFNSKIISQKQNEYEEIKSVYEPSESKYVVGLRQKLESIQVSFYSENEGETLYALGKGKYISIEQYTELYQISNTEMTEEQKEEIDEQLTDQSKRVQNKMKKIIFVQEILKNERRRQSKCMPRELVKLGRLLRNAIIKVNNLKSKLFKISEKGNQKSEPEKESKQEKEPEAQSNQEKNNQDDSQSDCSSDSENSRKASKNRRSSMKKKVTLRSRSPSLKGKNQDKNDSYPASQEILP